MISDVNECDEGIDDCAQLCTDTVGSYTCSCSSGHYLTDDSRGCEGNKHFMESFVIYNYYNIILYQLLPVSAGVPFQIRYYLDDHLEIDCSQYIMVRVVTMIIINTIIGVCRASLRL